MDSLPLSVTKIQAVWDLLPPGDRMEFLFDFSMYHERWSVLGQGDFEPAKSLEKGLEVMRELFQRPARKRCQQMYGMRSIRWEKTIWKR